jgi:hypothetical protein
VQIHAAGPQETRVERNTVRESRAMLEDSRARVFVLFLDTYHVDVSGSHDMSLAVTTRNADGVTWIAAQVSLAPLAPGDYIIEVVAGSDRRLAPFRVIP